MSRRAVGNKPHPTPAYLSEAALAYLSRFAASEASLRRVLTNKIRRAAMSDKDFANNEKVIETLKSAIETIIERAKKDGYVDDAQFARTKTDTLRRQGRSRRAITQKLHEKGIAQPLIQEALNIEENAEEAELTAARKMAKKRGFLRAPLSEDALRKALASLARGGFSYPVARQALSLEKNSDDTDFLSDEI